MNLNDNPTIKELGALLRECDDEIGNHVVWVDKAGQVHVSTLEFGDTPISLLDREPTMQMRLETFGAGNGYTGPKAADNERSLREMLEVLERNWRGANGSPRVHYCDR